jgi:hypothetical protein
MQVIDKVLQTVGSRMTMEEIEIIFRFRYSLTENKKALIKFLYTVRWEEEQEMAELPVLLALWKRCSAIDVADALKLLSKDKSFEHPSVRRFAVDVLREASDDELLTFLLQVLLSFVVLFALFLCCSISSTFMFYYEYRFVLLPTSLSSHSCSSCRRCATSPCSTSRRSLRKGCHCRFSR